jgi:hypothetical protein
MHPATDDAEQARRPIASLISKSEKAQQKLGPGTWQHAMLRDHLNALRVASALMAKRTDETDHLNRKELQEALRALAVMISKAEKAQSKFSPGTSPHTLQRNRLHALRIAEALTQGALSHRDA